LAKNNSVANISGAVCVALYTFVAAKLQQNKIMAYKKITATKVFNGTNYLPANTVIIIQNNQIIDFVPAENAGPDVQFFNGILTPGFINTHCHLELSHLHQAVPPHQGLLNFISAIISKRHMYAEAKQQAITQAHQAMYNNGIVAVADICNTTDTIAIKNNSSIYYKNFCEVAGFAPQQAAQRLQQIQQLAQSFVSAGLNATVVPHAPYSVSGALFNSLPTTTVSTIHNQEAAAENQLYQNKTGAFLPFYKNLNVDISYFAATNTTSLQSILAHFTNYQNLLLVHNTFTTNHDIAFLTNNNLLPKMWFCICANANQYIENTAPPLHLLMQHTQQITLGTDSLASNQQLNLLHEVATIKTFAQINTTTFLQWLTSNGAKALQIDNQFGYLKKGYSPGINLVNEALTSVQKIV
jgi:aminodeoxyfutalosine deaminase